MSWLPSVIKGQQNYSSPIGPSNSNRGVSTPSATAGIGGIISSLTGLAATGYNIFNQEKYRKEEQKRYEEARDYQKWLNQTLMDREDTAVYRRMKDLQKSGFNPLLAIADAASSSSGVGFSGNASPTDVDNSALLGMNESIKSAVSDSLQFGLEQKKLGLMMDEFRLKRVETLDRLISNSKDREEKEELIKIRKKELDVYNHNFTIARQYGEIYGHSPDPVSKSGIAKLLNNPFVKPTTVDNVEVPNHVKNTVEKDKKENPKADKIFKTISGYGPPKGDLKKYQFYTDLNTGIRYKFGEIWRENQ